MATNGCRTNGPGKPRTLPNRHTPDCDQDTCRGCLECPEPHCRVCAREHTDHVCGECIAATRDDLHGVRNTATDTRLLNQALHTSGVNSQALMLHAPAANREAWVHRATSAVLARLRGTQPRDTSYLEDNHDEPHPGWVLQGWADTWRTATNQPTDLPPSLDRAHDWLCDHLHQLVAYTDPDYVTFAAEVRATRAHLRAVLHDQNHGDTAHVGCFDCGGTLERRLTDHGFEDVWTCRVCHRRYTYAEYMFAVRANLEARATASA